jgi:hypothetical protein
MILILRRLVGLLVLPSRTWQDIAARPDGLGFVTCAYLPAVLALSAALCVLAVRLPALVAPRVTQHFRRGPDGSMELVAVGTQLSLPDVLGLHVLLPIALLVGMIGMMCMKIMTADNAPRFGAPADGKAATKVAIYASTPVWLAAPVAFLPGYGQTLALAMAGYGIYQVYLGAPSLLPGDPAQRDRFGTAMALRALGVGVGTLVLLLVLLMLVLIEGQRVPR